MRACGAGRGGSGIDILELIDQNEEALLGGKRARLGGGFVVDRERMLDLIDQMRSTVPAEIEQARTVLQERARVLAEAGEQAALLVTKAKHEVELLLDGHDLVRDAQRRASEIVEQAAAEARQIVEEVRTEAAGIRGSATSQAVEQAMEADRYSLDVLRRLEGQLTTLMASIRAGIEQLDRKMEREVEQRGVDVRDARLREGRAR